MSLALDGSNALYRESSVPGLSACTIVVFAKMSSSSNCCLAAILNSRFDHTDRLSLEHVGEFRVIAGADSDFVGVFSGVAATTDQWYAIAMRSDGTDVKLWVAEYGDTAATFSEALPGTGAFTAGVLYSGKNTYLSGANTQAGFKTWNTALSDSEVAAELASHAPIVTSGLVAYLEYSDPDVADNDTDASGTGDFTIEGTPTYDSDTPFTSGNTGTLNKTLDAATASGSGTVAISGSAAKTLDAATLDADGSVSITGSAAKTLDAATLDADGAVAITGSGAKTLDSAVLDADGSVAISGQLNKTLDAATLDADGTVIDGGTGQLNKTLDNATLAASGTVAITGQASKQLDSATVDGDGSVDITGALSKTLDAATLQASDQTAPPVAQPPLGNLGPQFFGPPMSATIGFEKPKKAKKPKREPIEPVLEQLEQQARPSAPAVEPRPTLPSRRAELERIAVIENKITEITEQRRQQHEEEEALAVVLLMLAA